MKKHLRIHGDNIVECERILNVILWTLRYKELTRSFTSKACMSITIITDTDDWLYFELFPGFNKNTSDRWNKNILDILTHQGSFLNETPDAILTEVLDTGENILIAIEFCSALQAGNQAWQRSGRAYSTARTKVCPYLYIVDFVKYELNTNTRERKALRFPNPAIPYSYINHTKQLGSPVLQAYFRSEEFQPSYDTNLSSFNTKIFSEIDVSEYLCKLIYHNNTTSSVKTIMDKNYEMVKFISNNSKANSFSTSDWNSIYAGTDIIDYVKSHKKFGFKKKIAAKSLSGHVSEFNSLVAKYSTGIASSDLPFGLIPSALRKNFIKELATIYGITEPEFSTNFNTGKDLIVCMLKGFKPGGDDNRPDRGLLPLISMLINEDAEILTFVYGPILENSLKLFDSNIRELARKNGLWQSFISLSNYIIIDAPILTIDKKLSATNERRIYNNNNNKSFYLTKRASVVPIKVSPEPIHYSENDVDTLMHTLLNYLVPNTFEGLCNPPGGDWSGLSIVNSLSTIGKEYRWLSLPRVSPNGKRPDHVFTIDNLLDKPIILTIESKEKCSDLEIEKNIGQSLKNYINYLFAFNPSVEKKVTCSTWEISSSKLNCKDFYCASVGCFLAPMTINLDSINASCNCDILIGFEPVYGKTLWNVKIKGFTPLGTKISNYLTNVINTNTSSLNIFK